MGNKDRAFRRLLGDKQIFMKFLRRFLKRDIPDEINVEVLAPEDLVLENISFLPPDLAEKASDVLWRIRRDDKDVYVYILVEHQSKIDFLMPYRLLSYMLQIWARCVEEAGDRAKRKSFLLPPIVPVVFYEGAERWTAARKFIEKVENADSFRGYIPDFEYRLISLQEKSAEELLAFGDSLGGLLYLASTSKKEGFFEAAERLRKFLLVLSDEEQRLLRNHLGGYLRILAMREGLEIDESVVENIEHEEADEVFTYLEREIRKIKKEGRAEGRAEGLAEGREEGRREGREEARFELCISLAQAMLSEGEPEEKILHYTGLTPEQLAEIRDGRR